MRTLPVQAHAAPYTEKAASASAIQLFPDAPPMSPILGRTIWNDSAAVLAIRFGPPSELTAGNVNAMIAAGGYYELPFGYVGEVSGKWASANGYARLSDIV